VNTDTIGGERQQSLKGVPKAPPSPPCFGPNPFSQKRKRKRINKIKRKSEKPFDYKTIFK